MSMTREEAVAAFLRDPGSVQYLNTLNHWVPVFWDDLNPLGVWSSDRWRLKPEPNQVPLGRIELRPGTPLRWGAREFDALVTCSDDNGVYCSTQQDDCQTHWTYKQLAKHGFADWWDGKTWRPCSKEVAS